MGKRLVLAQFLLDGGGGSLLAQPSLLGHMKSLTYPAGNAAVFHLVPWYRRRPALCLALSTSSLDDFTSCRWAVHGKVGLIKSDAVCTGMLKRTKRKHVRGGIAAGDRCRRPTMAI